VSLVRCVGLVGVRRRGSEHSAGATEMRASVRAKASRGWSGARAGRAHGPAMHNSCASPRAGKLSALFTWETPRAAEREKRGAGSSVVTRPRARANADGLARSMDARSPSPAPSSAPVGVRGGPALHAPSRPEPLTPEAASNISTDCRAGALPRGFQNLRPAPFGAFSNFARASQSRRDFDGTRPGEYSRAARERRGYSATGEDGLQFSVFSQDKTLRRKLFLLRSPAPHVVAILPTNAQPSLRLPARDGIQRR
jgi:hypothetical protein